MKYCLVNRDPLQNQLRTNRLYNTDPLQIVSFLNQLNKHIYSKSKYPVFQMITTKVIISSGWSAWLSCSVCMTYTIGLDDTRLPVVGRGLTHIHLVKNHGHLQVISSSSSKLRPISPQHLCSPKPKKGKKYMQHL